MKRLLFFLVLVSAVFGYIPGKGSRLNIYMPGQADSLRHAEARHLVFWVHTGWCRYCQAMQSTTFKDDNVRELLNRRFWFVMFDAEDPQDIRFNGQVFRFRPSGEGTGIHELAEWLAAGERGVSFPAFCILDTNAEIIFRANGFLSAEAVLQILTLIPDPAAAPVMK